MSKFQVISIKKAFLIIIFYALLFLGYGYYSYTVESQEAMKKIKKELLMGANSVTMLLPKNYHNRSFDITKISKEQDLQNTLRLSEFIRSTNLHYIYSCIEDENGTIRFSSSSATQKELENHSKDIYSFDTYNDPVMKKIFDENITTPVYTVSQDKWGSFESVYLLKFAPDGYRYIVGADYKYEEILSLQKHIIDKILYLILPLIIIIALYVFTNYFVFIYLKNSLAKKTRALKEAFEVDTLTKLPNKRKLVQDIKNHSDVTPIAILDINKFSILNDIYGSEYGDKYLQYTATILSNRLLGSMKLYKLESDAFAIICTQPKELETFQEYIATILKETSEKRFFYNSYSSKLLLTAGISDTARKNNPLIRAEIALKKAKAQGESIVVYSEDIDTNNHNKEVLDDITYALDHQKVFAYFQPIYDIKTNQIIKYEALMRIVKRDGTIATPAYFLDLAKHTPLYKELTLQMIQRVIEKAQSYPNYQFSINLSSLDIENKELINSLINSLKSANVEEQITIEILESEEFKDFDYLFAFVKQTRALGIKVSIDDFGSGYSNISSTIKLNIDYLKIDGSLIRDILTDSRYEKVLKSIVNFAKEMEAKTIAEYVESEAIAQKLKELDIDMLQGYYIGKPSSDLKI